VGREEAYVGAETEERVRLDAGKRESARARVRERERGGPSEKEGGREGGRERDRESERVIAPWSSLACVCGKGGERGCRMGLGGGRRGGGWLIFGVAKGWV